MLKFSIQDLHIVLLTIHKFKKLHVATAIFPQGHK